MVVLLLIQEKNNQKQMNQE